jgi:methylmalonyl-CoA mutase cobalamin-binding subunit
VSSPVSNTKGNVIIGGTESDVHVVPIYIIAQILQEEGYNTTNLSCCNKTENFFSKSTGQAPIAIIISNQNGNALNDLRDISEFREKYNSSVPIILGGHYYLGCHLVPSINERLYEIGVDFIVETPDRLLEILEQLRRSSVTGRLLQDQEQVPAFSSTAQVLGS